MAKKETLWGGKTKEEVIDIVLNRISGGESLIGILTHTNKAGELPSRKVFNEWLAADKTLSDKYARVCDERQEAMFEDIIDIADETSQDTIYTEKGAIPNTEWIQRSKVRIDARKWILSKMNPKKYGDKVDLTSDGEKINQPQQIIISKDGSEISLKVKD